VFYLVQQRALIAVQICCVDMNNKGNAAAEQKSTDTGTLFLADDNRH